MKAVIYELSFWVKTTHPGNLYEGIEACLRASGHTIIDSAVHFFKPQGYTAIWLLGESHAAVHTYPEKNTSYINLASCSKELYEQCRDLLFDKFGEGAVVEKESLPE